jgi:hypothetical protein
MGSRKYIYWKNEKNSPFSLQMKSKWQKVDSIETFHHIPPYTTPSPVFLANRLKGRKQVKIPIFRVPNIYCNN